MAAIVTTGTYWMVTGSEQGRLLLQVVVGVCMIGYGILRTGVGDAEDRKWWLGLGIALVGVFVTWQSATELMR